MCNQIIIILAYLLMNWERTICHLIKTVKKMQKVKQNHVEHWSYNNIFSEFSKNFTPNHWKYAAFSLPLKNMIWTEFTCKNRSRNKREFIQFVFSQGAEWKIRGTFENRERHIPFLKRPQLLCSTLDQ